MNERLSRTASSASCALRPRRVAQVRASAATSDAIFLAIVSSIFSPLPWTGCAAPMCVPGAIAATSAAIVMRKPADAARLPAGPTKTATGVLDAIMRETMARVESSEPAGRAQREDDERRAVALGPVHGSTMNSAETG